jgi:undecaprenyl-diphosphatase
VTRFRGAASLRMAGIAHSLDAVSKVMPCYKRHDAALSISSPMNSAIFDGINELSGHISFVDEALKWAAQSMIYLLVLAACSSQFWHRNPLDRATDRRVLMQAAISSAAALLVVWVIQQGYSHPRPFFQRHDVHLLVAHAPDASFPSEHVAIASAIGWSFFWDRRMWALPLILGALLIAFARVFVGVHYPADVAAGFALGVAISYCVSYLKSPLTEAERRLRRFIPKPLR